MEKYRNQRRLGVWIFGSGLATTALLWALFAMFLSPVSHAAMTLPNKMNFQGRLTDASGNPLTGNYDMQLKLYDAPTGGTLMWAETRTAANANAVPVTSGLFTVRLGEGTLIAPSTQLNAVVAANPTLYFEVTVGADAPMTPRSQLATSAYAFNSDTLDGLDSTAFASASGSSNYIQNQNAAQQAASNFWMSGTGRADTGLQAPLLDTATATTLAIGTTNATGIMLQKNTTLAAGTTLTINGGTTATRPASPTEGMVYYDTTTKQLLTYANGKWQGDGKTATAVVAAFNSTQAAKDAAQYVVPNAENSVGAGTGTIDGAQITINNALTAVSAAGGGVVYLEEGTYTVDASISVPNNVTLAGAGAATLIQLGNFGATAVSFDMLSVGGLSVVVRDMALNGRNGLNTNGTQRGINVGSYNGPRNILTNLRITNFRSEAVLFVATTYNTIANSYIESNGTGVRAQEGGGSINITDNTILSSTGNAISVSQVNAVNITGNVVQNSGSDAIALESSNSTVENNTISSSAGAGVTMYGSAGDIISGNRIQDSGGTIMNNGIYLTMSCSNNSIVGNDITDSAASSNNYAINFTTAAGSFANYLSSNRFSSSAGTPSIYDLAVGTIYSNQMDGSGNLINKGIGAMTVGTSTVNGTLSLQGGMTTAQLPSPAAPTVALCATATAGTTSYSYVVTALDGTGETLASTAGTIATGNAVLSATNCNTITWTELSGATSYKIYRTASAGTPATTGLIATVTATASSTAALNDTGLAATTATPTSNTTGGVTIAGAIMGASSMTLGTSSTTNSALVMNNNTNTNKVTIQSGATSASYTLTLPTALAASGSCLKDTTGTGVLGFGSCGGGSGGLTRRVVIMPEYAGGALQADGSNNAGVMNSDFVSGLSAAQGYKRNYYQWTSSNSTTQDYNIIANIQIPSEYASGLTNLKVWGYSSDTAAATATIQFSDQVGNLCYAAPVAFTPSTANTWEQKTVGAMSGCSFSANDIVTATIVVFAKNNAVFRVGEISYEYTN